MTADGRRFLTLQDRPAQGVATSRVEVVLNWFGELMPRAPLRD